MIIMGGINLKLDFFFAWTKNKDKNNEYTKSMSGGLKIPFIFNWLKLFFRKKK